MKPSKTTPRYLQSATNRLHVVSHTNSQLQMTKSSKKKNTSPQYKNRTNSRKHIQTVKVYREKKMHTATMHVSLTPSLWLKTMGKVKSYRKGPQDLNEGNVRQTIHLPSLPKPLPNRPETPPGVPLFCSSKRTARSKLLLPAVHQQCMLCMQAALKYRQKRRYDCMVFLSPVSECTPHDNRHVRKHSSRQSSCPNALLKTIVMKQNTKCKPSAF